MSAPAAEQRAPSDSIAIDILGSPSSSGSTPATPQQLAALAVDASQAALYGQRNQAPAAPVAKPAGVTHEQRSTGGLALSLKKFVRKYVTNLGNACAWGDQQLPEPQPKSLSPSGTTKACGSPTSSLIEGGSQQQQQSPTSAAATNTSLHQQPALAKPATQGLLASETGLDRDGSRPASQNPEITPPVEPDAASIVPSVPVATGSAAATEELADTRGADTPHPLHPPAAGKLSHTSSNTAASAPSLAAATDAADGGEAGGDQRFAGEPLAAKSEGNKEPLDLFEGKTDVYACAVRALLLYRPSTAMHMFLAMMMICLVQVTLLALLLQAAQADATKLQASDSDLLRVQARLMQLQLCQLQQVLSASNLTRPGSPLGQSWNDCTCLLSAATHGPAGGNSCDATGRWMSDRVHFASINSSATSHLLGLANDVVGLSDLQVMRTGSQKSTVLLMVLLSVAVLAVFVICEAMQAMPLCYAYAASAGILPIQFTTAEHRGSVVPMFVQKWRMVLAYPVPLFQMGVAVLAFSTASSILSMPAFLKDSTQFIINSVALAFILEIDDKAGDVMKWVLSFSSRRNRQNFCHRRFNEHTTTSQAQCAPIEHHKRIRARSNCCHPRSILLCLFSRNRGGEGDCSRRGHSDSDGDCDGDRGRGTRPLRGEGDRSWTGDSDGDSDSDGDCDRDRFVVMCVLVWLWCQ